MNQVVIITGGSSGIGAQTAVTLHEAGYVVYAAARRLEQMAELRDRGIAIRSLDVTDDASMRALVSEVQAAHGTVDVLINNAGYGHYGAVEEVPLSQARDQFEVNVFGLARMVQLVTPIMRERGHGRIVNISSIAGKIPGPMGAWYHASKYAVEGFSDSLRVELAPFGIQVILIEPGPILTQWNRQARQSLADLSSSGVYAAQSASVAAALERADRPGRGSPPSMVAEVILKALGEPQPKARYAAGRGARTMINVRRLLPDRVIDSLVSRTFQPS